MMKTLLTTCVSILFLCAGCDPSYELKKVSSEKNTFELDFPFYGRVDDVLVFELSELNEVNYDDPVWGIKNKNRSSSGRFRVTVPKIPGGFIQVAPSPPEQFELQEGQRYIILMCYPGGASSSCWIGEK